VGVIAHYQHDQPWPRGGGLGSNALISGWIRSSGSARPRSRFGHTSHSRATSGFSASRQRLSANCKLSRGCRAIFQGPRELGSSMLFRANCSAFHRGFGRRFMPLSLGALDDAPSQLKDEPIANRSQFACEPVSRRECSSTAGKGISRPETLGYLRRKCAPENTQRLRTLSPHAA
jgi:hypothetical protein